MPIILVIENNGEEKREKLTSSALLLGRSNSCHIRLSDGQVSGKHLTIAIGKDGKTLVKDLDTTNGTFLNGSKVIESHLFLDDLITIGEIKIYIDPIEMTAKEKAIHTRAGEKTQHTFVNLPIDEAKAIKKAMESAKASQSSASQKNPPPTKASFKNESARQKEIMELLKKEDPPPLDDIPSDSDTTGDDTQSDSPGMRTRVINKAKQKKKESKERVIHEVRDGKNFDLEESSGETQMLKITKVKKRKK